MESFKLKTTLGGSSKEVLIIPDDCDDRSIFHVVLNGSEIGKLIYTDSKKWELTEEDGVQPTEVENLGRLIEEHYF